MQPHDDLDSGARELGELPHGVPIDGVTVTLWLPDLTLTYSSGYPPSGITEFDALLWEIMLGLSECDASEHYELAAGCEVLADYPS